ncbi:MAG: SDR family NAD(P)-dependent oxidoreductase [Proteobacteria bacterium]|nr:SDR family NAD(P)-dependent oxidoreductase [Pseudomonadota bacterium]
MNIKGSVAIVTGGVSGLGAATSRLLVERGARVVAVDLNARQGESFAAQFGDELLFFNANIADEAEIRAAVDLAASLGPLRICINCAGMAVPPARTVGRGPTPYPLDRFRMAVEVNLIGTFNVTRLAATQMALQEPYDAHGSRGAIVNVGSVAACDGQTGQVAYAAAKAGIAGMTLPLARDLSAVGIRVCTILPGTFETPIYQYGAWTQEQILDFKNKLIADNVHPKRMGDPREFATLALELIQNEFMNGETIRIDAASRMRANPNQ